MSCISRCSPSRRSLLSLLNSSALGETSTAATTGLLDFATALCAAAGGVGAAGAGWGVAVSSPPPRGGGGARGGGGGGSRGGAQRIRPPVAREARPPPNW